MTPVHEVIKAFLEWRDNGNRALAEEFTGDEIVYAMVKEKIRPNTGDHELHLLMTMRLDELKDLDKQKREPNRAVQMTTNHVFISYVHENEVEAQRLADELTGRGLSVWLDKNMINPGSRWQDAIAEAIDSGDFFIACFSKEYNRKNESYMNKEIGLAIERLSNMPHEREWFIPVVFSGTVPKWRIGGGETLHDIQWVELNEANWDQGVQQIFQTIQPPRHLRAEAIDNLSGEAVKSMLQEHGFFDNQLHWDGRGLLHQYEEIKRQGQKLVIDHTTSLTWQQSSSPERITFEEAQKYIQELRDKKYAGFSYWRLPTLEEAMSLMEPKKNEHGLHIDPIFDKKPLQIWTSDKFSASRAWTVHVGHAGCVPYDIVIDVLYVRAVG